MELELLYERLINLTLFRNLNSRSWYVELFGFVCRERMERPLSEIASMPDSSCPGCRMSMTSLTNLR